MLTRRRVLGGLIAVMLVSVAYFGVSWVIVGQALEADVIAFEHEPEDFALRFEDVGFTPRGEPDVTLRGWWFPVDDAVGTVIWVHGLDHNRAERIPLIRDLVGRGFAALAFDLRGHGESDQVQIGAGFFETQDVRGGIDFLLNEKGIEPGTLLLMGHSFGAAVAIMAGAGESALVGVYADSAFASLTDVVVEEVALRTPIPKWGAGLLRPGILFLGDWLKGVDIDAVRPEEAIAGYDYVVGLAHCGADERIALEHGVRLEAAAPPSSLLKVYPDCGHVDAYEEFPEQYVDTVTSYFNERLGVQSP